MVNEREVYDVIEKLDTVNTFPYKLQMADVTPIYKKK